jgi:hypothetical protein
MPSMVILATLLIMIAGGCNRVSPPGESNASPDPGESGVLAERPLRPPIATSGGSCQPTKGRPSSDLSPEGGDAIALGSGPAYPAFLVSPAYDPSSEDAFVPLYPRTRTDGWFAIKVFWIIQASYAGPLLVRGEQIDGADVIRFGTGGMGEPSLFFESGADSTSKIRGLPSTMRIRSAGCFFLQVEGSNFSIHIIFGARE